MSQIAFPRLDATILARRDAILNGLAAILPPDVPDRRRIRAARLRDRRADRLPPPAARRRRCRARPRKSRASCGSAATSGVNVVPRGAGTSLSGGAIPQEDASSSALTKMSRILEDQPRRPLRARRSGRHQSRDFRGGRRRGLLLCARPVLAARLHDRRQHRDELGRRALPEIRRHDQQPARRPARHPRRRDPRYRRRRRWTRPATTGSASCAAPRASSAS